MPDLLPIEPFLPQIGDLLSSGKNLVLVAEPGSGKTTRVPPYLLDATWLSGKKILMLEPRRLAAKAGATYIASKLGEAIGGRVGYRIRGESKIGSKTKLEVITEGVLTRTLQIDPSLENVGLIIFDEFHERSIHADLSLALALESQRLLRPDLRIMIMSATINADEVSNLIGNSEVLNCPGKQYPVKVIYGKPLVNRWIEDSVIETIRKAESEKDGDILVFLPGRAEIRRIAEKLKASGVLNKAEILPLHSEIRGGEQDKILAPGEKDARRIILSTNVAETSVTIPRIRIVIDSGLMRVPRFNPRRGVSGLETVTISQASAKQRSGRAGREAPGTSYRLWSEHEERRFDPFNQPEILQADLSTFILELAAWGESDPSSYSFITKPPEAHVAQARALLQLLNAIDQAGKITSHGRELLRLALPPRLSHMLLLASQRGEAKKACELVALLEAQLPPLNRDTDSLVSNRLDEFKRSEIGRGAYPRGVVERIKSEAEDFYSLLPKDNGKGSQEISIAQMIALAYPERLSKAREPNSNRFLMRAGFGAVAGEIFKKHEYLAIAHLDGGGENARVFLAEPITIKEIRELFSSEIINKREIQWKDRSVRTRGIESLGALTLSEKPASCSDEEAWPFILEGIKEHGFRTLPFSDQALSLIHRTMWLKEKENVIELPDLGERSLIANLENWLLPYLPGIRSLNEISESILENALKSILNHKTLKLINELAPPTFTLPSGRVVQINYEGPRAPSISGKLQEMFGQTFSPRICQNRVALTIELLSPAGRPLQVTSDLESFWKNSYQEVRKEMAGRYPKHPWPLNPTEELPTRGTKKRITR